MSLCSTRCKLRHGDAPGTDELLGAPQLARQRVTLKPSPSGYLKSATVACSGILGGPRARKSLCPVLRAQHGTLRLPDPRSWKRNSDGRQEERWQGPWSKERSSEGGREAPRAPE
ncbi:hypothetical protein NDU88_006973 [Pleurodeles waltl]|uniref:Uncharacterized protein n=1 Tax=Pleurodeles waltl TaxID=8319 RepID=A0AAV7MDS8_PLEWA|nr:hypothetical protein NDU88_006973 [Pleurodeles waltl]